MTTATKERRVNPWFVVAMVCVPAFVGSLDLTIVSAFLPEIIVNLELPVQSVIDDAAWVVSGYLLAYTVSMMFMGRVSDLVGRRAVYVACLLIFIAGSYIVASVDPEANNGFTRVVYNLTFRAQGFPPDRGNVALTTIIIGRVVQALGAGAIVPVSLALVADLFPVGKRAQPLGVIGAVDTLGWVLGHLYGGIMVSWFSTNAAGFVTFFESIGLNWGAPDWRALFWINIPISILTLVLTVWALIGVRQKRAQGRFDWVGTLLIGGALICLVVGLGANIEVAGTTQTFEDLGGLPPYAAPVLTAGALMFVAFIFVETRVRDPLFDLKQFRRRNFSAGLVTNLTVGFCLMIGLVSVPILVNIRVTDMGASVAEALAGAALQAGILLSTLTVPMALAAIPGGWLSERFNYGVVAGGGMLMALVGFALMALTWRLDIADAAITLHMALVGVGLGLTFSPVSAAVINDAERGKVGVASALVIIMRLVGMTVSVSILTTFASQRLAFLAVERLGDSVVDPTQAIDVYAELTVRVLTEIGWLGVLVCFLGAVPALLMRRRADSVRDTAELLAADTVSPETGK